MTARQATETLFMTISATAAIADAPHRTLTMELVVLCGKNMVAGRLEFEDVDCRRPISRQADRRPPVRHARHRGDAAGARQDAAAVRLRRGRRRSGKRRVADAR